MYATKKLAERRSVAAARVCAKKAAQSNSRSAAETGRRLYRDAWSKVADTFFEVEKLRRWSRWENRFSRKIKDVDDGIRYANRMLASLKDEYTWVRDAEEVAGDEALESDSVSGIGIFIAAGSRGAQVKSVFKGTPAERAGLKPRDLITKVDDTAFAGLDESQMLKVLRGSRGTVARLEFERDGKQWDVYVPRAKIATPAVSFETLPDGIGYVRIDSFQQRTTSKQLRRILKENLAQWRAIVLDMRANAGGYTDQALECAALFLRNAPLTTFIERREGTPEHNVNVHYSGRRKQVRLLDPQLCRVDGWIPCRVRCVVPAEMKIVMLVDAETVSAGELFTGALKDNNRAVVVGQRTFGKGIGQTTYELPAGLDVQVTSFKYHTPAGLWPGDAQRQRYGIKPHTRVRGDGRYAQDGLDKDRQMQFALRHLSRAVGR